MTIEWETLRRLIVEGDAPAIATAVRDLSAEERENLAVPLKDFERRTRRGDDRAVPFNHLGALTLAGAGILSSPSDLAPWFRRHGVGCVVGPPYVHFPVADLVLDVLHSRRASWLGTLARRLAELPGGFPPLVLELAAIAGIDPPMTDQLAEGWAVANRAVEPGAIAPAWDALLLRVMELDRLGRTLEFHDGKGLGLAVVTFVAEGRLDRTLVIDLCMSALQRGGSQSDVRGYLAVYNGLELDVPEIVARLRDYLPLLAEGHSTVAGMAQRDLFRADDAGALPPELLLAASRSVFARSERKLVRAQLDRHRTALERRPEMADALLHTLTGVFDHESMELRQRALDLAVAFASTASATTRSELATKVGELPPDLQERAAGAFGSPVAQARMPTPALPAPPPPSAVTPVESVEELAAEVAVLRSSLSHRVDPVVLERVLDGLVTWCYRDRNALRAAVGGTSEEIDWDRWLLHSISEYSELAFAITAAATPALSPLNAPFPELETFTGGRGWQQKLSQSHGQRPYTPTVQPGLLLARLHEIAVGVVHAPRPFLVAAPTTTTGVLDPAELLARLTIAAIEGWHPWRRDLTQALLRLPANSDPSLASPARALRTRAGDRLARWLETDPDERVDTCLPQVLGRCGELPHDVADAFMTCWPAMLPGYRDVVARHLTSESVVEFVVGPGGGRLLTTLAEADGPVGAATLDAFVRGMNADQQHDRAGAVDGLLILAGKGELDGAAFGKRLAERAAAGDVVLGRTVPCLRDLSRAGATPHVWAATAAALPALLDVQRPPSGLADFLALGVELAQDIRPKTNIPHLADVAGRRGSSRVVTEARRLAAALG